MKATSRYMTVLGAHVVYDAPRNLVYACSYFPGAGWYVSETHIMSHHTLRGRRLNASTGRPVGSWYYHRSTARLHYHTHDT